MRLVPGIGTTSSGLGEQPGEGELSGSAPFCVGHLLEHLDGSVGWCRGFSAEKTGDWWL